MNCCSENLSPLFWVAIQTYNTCDTAETNNNNQSSYTSYDVRVFAPWFGGSEFGRGARPASCWARRAGYTKVYTSRRYRCVKV